MKRSPYGTTRRDWLRMTLGASSGLAWRSWQARLEGAVLPTAERASQASGSEHAAPTLRSYADPLPIPPVIRPVAAQDDILHIRMRPCRQQVHRDLAPTRLWGYNGRWPGPTIEVRRGHALSVRWLNELPTKHFLPIDPTIHGAHGHAPEVRTVVHVHGAQVLPESDGYPEAWSTSDGHTGLHYSPKPCVYPNDQPASTLWYHDHALGITRLNVYAGLAGLYVIRDEEEDALNLPRGPFEIPLLLQDRSFNPDGSLRYPVAHDGTHPVWIQEFFGETICVNGKAAPFLDVEPRRYRFRIVNGSNARFYHLTLMPADAGGRPVGSPVDAPAFHQIGTDGGLLPFPVVLHYLIIAPGERFDLVVDFADQQGASFVLINDAPAPYARGGEVVPTDVMRINVTRTLSGPDTSALPDQLVSMSPLNPGRAVRERVLAITEMDRPSDGYTMIGLLGQKRWDDPVTEDPIAGSMEIWSFANTTGDVHPIHSHLVRFQVLNRQTFDVQTYLQTGKLLFTGIPRPPEVNERPAWKDTIKTYPGTLTRVIQRFDLPSGTSVLPGQEFLYVWHCHVLEHEDNEMMRPYKVVSA